MNSRRGVHCERLGLASEVRHPALACLSKGFLGIPKRAVNFADRGGEAPVYGVRPAKVLSEFCSYTELCS
jgi:hypothetical protein